MRKLGGVAAAAIVLIAGAARADAAPITGGVSFGGLWAPTGGGGTIATATGIDIIGNAASVTCAFPVPSCTGTYAALNGSPVAATYNDFTFAPLSAPSPLWSISFGGNTYTFSLSSVTIVSQNSTGITLSGTGTLTATGFSATPGTFSFSGDTSGALLAFSSTGSAAPVPEPASMLLFGTGMLGLAQAARRRLRRQ